MVSVMVLHFKYIILIGKDNKPGKNHLKQKTVVNEKYVRYIGFYESSRFITVVFNFGLGDSVIDSVQF